MDNLYQETSLLIQQVQFGLGRLEQTTNESQAQPIFQDVYRQMSEIGDKCKNLDHLVSKEAPERKRAAKYRTDQLKYDYQCLTSSFNALQTRLTGKWRAAAEREELLHQRIKPHETQVNFGDHELNINDKLKHSHNALDDMIANGTAVLSSIREQGVNLTGIRRRVLDIGATLGISDTTLRMIERRVGEDWILFLIGCLLVLIFMYCFYRFWKG